MSNLTKYPLEDGFQTTLSQAWTGAVGTVYVNDTPSFTFPSGVTTYIVVNPGKTNQQAAIINAYDSALNTLTVSSIAVNKAANVPYTAQSHAVGSTVIISDNYQFWEDIATSIATKMNTDGGNGNTYADTAARDAALGANGAATQNYRMIKAGANYYNYNLSTAQWEVISTGTATPNASTTVAGIVEIATTAETIAGTDTGGTGAKLVALPSDIAKNIQSDTFEYGVDVGGDDTYVFALTPTLAAYTTGQLLRGKVTTGNTGACTADFGPGVKNIKLTDGTDPLTGDILANSINDFIYDGTNLVLQTVAQRASSAEALAGTNTVKYLTPATGKASVQDSIGVPTSVWTASGSGAKTSGNIQAATSGFVTATCGSSFANYVLAYVGATNPATTLIGSCSRNSGQSVYTSLCIPVKKGYYYRLDGSGVDSGDSYQAYFTPSN